MARDAVAITALPVNEMTAAMTAVAIDPANGAIVAAGGDTHGLFLRVANSTAAEKAVTVKAGVNPPAFRASGGDLVVAFAQDAVKFVALESARFVQTDGSIHIDFAADMTGTVECYRV